MYNEKLEALITAALADGVLTEKEKQILFKKAEAMGIDLDEFEMVLDARLVELKKKEAKANQQYQLEMEKAKSAQPSAPKSEKYGDVRKCPACGAIVPSMAAKCPECGYEFTNVEANSSTRLLMQKIDEIQAQYAELTANVDNKDESTIRTRGYQVKRQLNDRTAQLIQNFPIPNTREDLIEFLTLCIGNSKADSIMLDGNDPVTPAWRKKLQQVIAKVKVALPNDQQAQELIEEYEGKRENSIHTISIGIIRILQSAFHNDHWTLMEISTYKFCLLPPANNIDADTEMKRAAIQKADAVRGTKPVPDEIWADNEEMILKLSGLL